MTGDALHTRRDHARFLVEEKKTYCAFTVKRNQKNLYEQLRTLPWQKATAKYYDRTEGHGCKETRVVQVLTVTDLGVGFPHAAQVMRHRKAEPRDRLGHHRLDQPPGIPGTRREDLEGALGCSKTGSTS
ncbi:hypothetical protein ABZT02_38980 [Streptomyces sp. NPDC005402]|uniref:hypothetical protein n=1 Tax=Streptomyces sp. NPDC005402 TaxID=3155338 RepID=UPI0033AB1578